MRIVQVGKFYPPVCGGMERVVCELSEGLTEFGHEVKTIVASECGRFSEEKINGVDVVRLKSEGKIFSQPLFSGLRNEIRKFRPDVVHFHLPNPLALFTGYCSDFKTCMTIHAEASGVRGPLDRLLTLPYTWNSQALVFSSRQMADFWTMRQFKTLQKISTTTRREQKVKVIPFGFKFNYLQKVGAHQDPFLILFVGRLVPYKGIETLIEAMRRVEGKLAIIGTGPLRATLEQQTRNFGIQDNIQFLGNIPDSGLADWYERCAIYVQPSISTCEAFGISMLEAMHVGRAIVSTDLPTGVQAVNQHLRTGLVVPPQDAISLSAALNTLLKDQELTHKFGQNAHDHARQFSANSMILEHQKLYESLIEKTSNKAILPEKSELTL